MVPFLFLVPPPLSRLVQHFPPQSLMHYRIIIINIINTLSRLSAYPPLMYPCIIVLNLIYFSSLLLRCSCFWWWYWCVFHHVIGEWIELLNQMINDVIQCKLYQQLIFYLIAMMEMLIKCYLYSH